MRKKVSIFLVCLFSGFSIKSFAQTSSPFIPQEGGANVESLEGWLRETSNENSEGIKKARETISKVVQNQKIINQARQKLNSNPGTGPIYKHLKGNDGIAFDVIDPSSQTLPAKPEDAEKYVSEIMDIRQKYYQELMKPAPPLPNCLEDKTDKEITEIASGSKKGQLIMDMLFIKEKEGPLNLQEALGTETQIIPYKGDRKDPLSYATLGLGVECLPYRIRIVQGAIFRDYGKNAYKSYLDNQFGKGRDPDKVRTVARERKSK